MMMNDDDDDDRKVTCSNLGKSGGRIFFSRVNFVCADELVPVFNA